MFDEALVCCKCKSHWDRGHVCTSEFREVPWDSRGEGWEVALYAVISSDLLYIFGAHIPITQQKRIPSPCWKHTNPGQDEASTLQIQGCPLGPLDSLSPARYLIYTVEYLLWTILHFLSFYYWQCKCKCQWSPLWFPPNLKNRNEGQLLRTLVSKRSNHYGQRRPYLENLACVQEFFSRQSKSDEAEAVPSLQGLRSQQSRKLEHLLVQVHEWWASSAEKAPATNPS